MPDSHCSYARILSRVNSLPSASAKTKARNILGWVGCCPTPLTIQELDQALMVDVDNLDSSVRGSSNLNIVELCGPIVEVVDDYVQFVHFTVKEYVALLAKNSKTEHHRLIPPDIFSTHALTAISATQKRLSVLPRAAFGTFSGLNLTPCLKMRRI